MELVGAGHGVDVSTVPTSRIWWPAFCPIGVQTCMFFFWVPPDFKKMFCLGYEKRGFRSSVGPHGNQLSFFHKYEDKLVSHANACAACLIPPRTATPDNMGCTAAHVNNRALDTVNLKYPL